jgi:coproporphyrinogen III oxidase-like Fe-S oxidoreductase
MKRTDAQLISKVLEIYFEENPQLAEKLAETRLIASWERVLGSMVMRYTGKLFIRKKCLYVQLYSAVVKNELLMCRERLIQNLNREVGRDVIYDIVFTN